MIENMKSKDLKFAPIHEMAKQFELYCESNGWEILDKNRACGGSMYFEVFHTETGVRFTEIRISNHPHKYNAPDYSVGDDSFEGLFDFMQNVVSAKIENPSMWLCDILEAIAA
jgi:hypothetical protein